MGAEERLKYEKHPEVSIEIKKFDKEENKKKEPLLEKSSKTRKKSLTNLIKGMKLLARFAFLFWDFIFFVFVLAHYHRYHLFSYHDRHRYLDLQYAASSSLRRIYQHSILGFLLR